MTNRLAPNSRRLGPNVHGASIKPTSDNAPSAVQTRMSPHTGSGIENSQEAPAILNAAHIPPDDLSINKQSLLEDNAAFKGTAAGPIFQNAPGTDLGSFPTSVRPTNVRKPADTEKGALETKIPLLEAGDAATQQAQLSSVPHTAFNSGLPNHEVQVQDPVAAKGDTVVQTAVGKNISKPSTATIARLTDEAVTQFCEDRNSRCAEFNTHRDKQAQLSKAMSAEEQAMLEGLARWNGLRNQFHSHREAMRAINRICVDHTATGKATLAILKEERDRELEKHVTSVQSGYRPNHLDPAGVDMWEATHREQISIIRNPFDRKIDKLEAQHNCRLDVPQDIDGAYKSLLIAYVINGRIISSTQSGQPND